jgi:peptidoglycan/LPS O-acetylase OafA/YrhL
MYFVIWWAGVDLARSYISYGRVRPIDALASGFSIIVISAILVGDVMVHNQGGGALQFGIHPILELRHFVAAAVTLVVALAWQKAKWLGFSLLKPFTIIAPISYSLYISHQPLLTGATYLNVIGHRSIEYALYLAILLLFCWFTELKLYPALRRKQR